MAKVRISLHMWLDVSTAFIPHECEKCGGRLQYVWVGDYDLSYFECIGCNAEYLLLATYVPIEKLNDP